MYHIKKDKRQQDSALRLMKGLTDCLQTKKMSDIGISELCNVSGVSRSTFYRMFDTQIDLLEYTSDYYIERAIADYSGEVFRTADDFVLYSLMYWKNHEDLLEALINCKRLDIVRKSFEAHSELIEPIFESQFTKDELEYVKVGASGLVTSLLSLWFERGKKESPARLFEIYKKINGFRME